MNAETLASGRLAALLRDTAAGMLADTAAADLIIAHGHFLHDPAFRRIIAAGPRSPTGSRSPSSAGTPPSAPWRTGTCPAPDSERAVLLIAASLAEPGITVSLRDMPRQPRPPQHRPRHRRHHRRQRLTPRRPRPPGAAAGRNHHDREPAVPLRLHPHAVHRGRPRPRPVLLRRPQGSRRPPALADLRPRPRRPDRRSRRRENRRAARRRRRPGRLPPHPDLPPNPQVGVRGIHGALATALGQAPRFHHADLIPQVEAALAAEADERNRNVILAIDESHLLTGEQLEAVRMMTSHGPRLRLPADRPAHRPADPPPPPARR